MAFIIELVVPYLCFRRRMKILSATIFAAGLVNAATIYSVVDMGPVDYNAPLPMSYSNASGQTVGGNGHAFVTDGTTTTDLGVLPGGEWSAAYGINASGAVVGYGDTSVIGQFLGFIWTSSTGMTALSTLGGGISSAMAINDGGDVAGSSIGSNGYIHAVIWSGGQIHDLGTLGGTSSGASGINNAGAVVGSGDVGSGYHAFLYSAGVMTDLNTFIPGDSGWVLNSGLAINNSGQIVGLGLHDGAERVFELDPVGELKLTATAAVPEPSAFAFLAIGLGLAGCRATIKVGWRKSANRTRNGSGN